MLLQDQAIGCWRAKPLTLCDPGRSLNHSGSQFPNLSSEGVVLDQGPLRAPRKSIREAEKMGSRPLTLVPSTLYSFSPFILDSMFLGKISLKKRVVVFCFVLLSKATRLKTFKFPFSRNRIAVPGPGGGRLISGSWEGQLTQP